MAKWTSGRRHLRECNFNPFSGVDVAIKSPTENSESRLIKWNGRDEPAPSPSGRRARRLQGADRETPTVALSPETLALRSQDPKGKDLIRLNRSQTADFGQTELQRRISTGNPPVFCPGPTLQPRSPSGRFGVSTAGSLGDHSNVLPHVVLNRSTCLGSERLFRSRKRILKN
jgi:hypothetical protein